MLSFIFGYLLTLFLAFTLIMVFSFLVRILAIIILSKSYSSIFNKNQPAEMLAFSMKIVQPIGFLTSILHGYASLWMGKVILGGLSVKVDWYLGAFLIFSFLYWGSKRIKKPLDVTVDSNENKNPNERKVNEEVTLIIDPTLKEETSPTKNLGSIEENIKNKLKGQAQEFLQGNTIVGLIGKVTGVVLASLDYIFL